MFVYGWYAEVLYFLTSDHREYEKKVGNSGRVIPKETFGTSGSLGAFHVGARYDQMSLVDSGMDGGRLEDVTVRLNRFLNPNLKIQSNYACTIRDAQAGPVGGDYYGYMMRLAWDF